jgi:hypothetical protein
MKTEIKCGKSLGGTPVDFADKEQTQGLKKHPWYPSFPVWIKNNLQIIFANFKCFR